MTLITGTAAPHRLEVPPSFRMRAVPVGPGRWRVLDAAGRAVGHIETHDDPRGVRYRARRYHAPTTRFRDVGDFWSVSDALACLR